MRHNMRGTSYGDINRAAFLRRAGAGAALAAVAGVPGLDSALAGGRGGGRRGRPRGLRVRAISYDVGIDYGDGVLSRLLWSRSRVRHELEMVSRGLRCNAVSVTGSHVDRLFEAAEEAQRQGLATWVHYRIFDQPRAEFVEVLREVGERAERLRRRYSREVVLNLGVEATIQQPGLGIPGDTWEDRLSVLQEGLPDPQAVYAELNEFLGEGREAVRGRFRGRLTYSAGSWEQVDWNPFDIVSVNLYRTASNAADYPALVRAYRTWNKPVAITEFGCCTFEGAADLGPLGWLIIDYSTPLPTITGNPVRSEAEQARYILELLDVHEAEGVYAAFPFTFMEATQPHSEDPLYDLDMASFAVVKLIRSEYADPTSPYVLRPKEAFRALARRYRRYPSRH
jgi:hypothetical protein